MQRPTKRISHDEVLGRHAAGSDDKKKVDRFLRDGDAALPTELFIQEDGHCLSVDRLHPEHFPDVRNVARHIHQLRHPPRELHGWLSVPPTVAGARDREVIESPMTKPVDNPYHADIVLPRVVLTDGPSYEDHAMELASAASWWPVSVDSLP